MRNLITIVVCFVLLWSCESEPANKSHVNNEAENELVTPVDSTDFYDSVYSNLDHQLDTFFLNRHNQSTFYGNVLFAKNGWQIFSNVYGNANLESKDTLTLDHTFQLASASKPITAVAVMQLVEWNKIKLTDDINKYIKTPYSGITIHQLLSHRSGLSQYTHFCDAPDSIWPDKHKTITNEQVIDIMNDIVPMVNYAPDHTFYYCNTNYMLLASLVEKVSGSTFESYVEENIFIPAKMHTAKIYNRENYDSLKNPAKGYNGAFNPTIDIYLNGVTGDKGVYASVKDLLAFEKALYDETLISDTSRVLMMTPKNKTKPNGQNYGYGFRLMPAEGIVYHSGWWKGFRTYFIMHPETRRTVIVLSNIKRGKFFRAEKLMKIFKI